MPLLVLLSVGAIFFSCTVAAAQSAPTSQGKAPPSDWVRLLALKEHAVVIAKKPEVKGELTDSIDKSTLVVILDGIDVTQLLTLDDKGFAYQPAMVLPAGKHQLSVTAKDKAGKPLHKTFSFSTRHTAALEEAYADNMASVAYEAPIKKSDSAIYVPRSKVEGNLQSLTKIKEKAWEFTLNTNLRYLDQNLPVLPPQRKGLDVANWVFTGTYTKDQFKLQTSLGDILVSETPYTAAFLARRGGVFNLEYDVYQLRVFNVRTEQVFGFKGGAGVGGSLDDHLLGVSGGVKLFDKKVEFRTIYLTGGEKGGSFGISTIGGAKEGNVLGFLLASDFFQNKLKTELETAFSSFDPDTSDAFDKKKDKAYRFKIYGFLDKYHYDVMYEHLGRDYAVVGNQMLQKDKEGVSARGGANFGVHVVTMLLSRYHDNVREDPLFPRIVSYQGSVDYSFMKIPHLPVGIGYQKTLQDSTREPANIPPIDLGTDTMTGRAHYLSGAWSIGLTTAYSRMNDRTPANNDTTAQTYTLTPAYTTPGLSVAPSFSLNQTKVRATGVTTDTYTMNLDARTKVFQEKVSLETGGTYNIMKADNGSVDGRNLNARFRLAYSLKPYAKALSDPAIALRGSYLKNADRVNAGLNKEEYALVLVLATGFRFSF